MPIAGVARGVAGAEALRGQRGTVDSGRAGAAGRRAARWARGKGKGKRSSLFHQFTLRSRTGNRHQHANLTPPHKQKTEHETTRASKKTSPTERRTKHRRVDRKGRNMRKRPRRRRATYAVRRRARLCGTGTTQRVVTTKKCAEQYKLSVQKSGHACR